MKPKKINIWLIGLAMFTMFFGAGNVVFPLLIGAHAGDQVIYAILGFLIMGVGIPFCGLFAIILYDGDYRAFFSRIGVIPGFIAVLILLTALGPVLAMPRIISLSYSTLHITLPSFWFNLIICVTLFFLTLYEDRVIDILGYVLSPLLMLTLVILIIVGLCSHADAIHNSESATTLVLLGMKTGYNTMDLLAAFFFAAVVYRMLRAKVGEEQANDKRQLASITLRASLVGAGLLGTVYIGFIVIAARHSQELQQLAPDQLIYQVAKSVLGSYASIVASSAFALACLTTAMVLGVIVAQFIQQRLLRDALPYWVCLLLTYAITFLFANIGFNDLVKYASPILSVLYPALIMLTLCNIAHQLWGFRWVKLPTALVLLGMIGLALW